MADVIEKVRDLDAEAPVMQWRGSDDGIRWTVWQALRSLSQLVDRHFYYQGRIFIDGRWVVSKIERDD